MSDWLVTLRKHRNYALRERETGYTTNNQDADTPVVYAYNSYCDIETRVEFGSCSPLTCPVLKHGVIPNDLSLALKTNSKGVVSWDNASNIQKKVTTLLRSERANFKRISSVALQQNLVKLDNAFTNFWKHGRGFPRYLRTLDSFQYSPGQVKVKSFTDNYAVVYLPGIGNVKMHNSRDLSGVKLSLIHI